MTAQALNQTQADVEVDASGLNCPMPVLKTKKAIVKMQPGQVLHLIATDSGSIDDIPPLLVHLNCELLESNTTDGKFHFYIRKQ